MFNNIAHSYDFLNHFFSMGIDKKWRKKLVAKVEERNPVSILDVATGTADLAISLATINSVKIHGIDISANMLEVGKKKILKHKLSDKVVLSLGDSENIQFPEASFDAVTVSFGVRNFENLNSGLKEMRRVLTVNGRAYILEFSQPSNLLFKKLYWFYFKNLMPFIGKLISKDYSAYSYLPESVKSFPYGVAFLDKLKEAGFSNCKQIPLTFGIATLYIAEK
ncbi:MAG: bifunctional demethylmenaquinone methyltransferase/2-methoxy-6-polyprenyl-1,4-benzoquinol methylase UbiE [Bacteroidetes bacterium]|nr:bifunctional demethylmenaquinone methyltransferase/2-methoxy-6-polyprenyl-1,4-benzoquinol methylase UbiE [Bacteroidota bacterium]